MFSQRTVAREVKFSGVGLHSNKMSNIKLLPSEIDSGIIIKRVDIKDKNNVIKADFTNVSEVLYSTKLSNDDGVEVSTIEHLMAAIWAMKISNLIIEIDSTEIPILDGCSQGFIFLLESIGIVKQDKIRPTIKVTKEISINYQDGRSIFVIPADNLIATFSLKNEFEIISNGSGYTYNDAKQSFMNDISLARTYCHLSDVEKLQSMGLAMGGDLTNALVVDGNKVLNPEGLNYQNEFVRHKILDLIGDIALCKYYIAGHFIGHNSGHEMNNKLMRKIFEDEENYVII